MRPSINESHEVSRTRAKCVQVSLKDGEGYNLIAAVMWKEGQILQKRPSFLYIRESMGNRRKKAET